MLALRVFFVFSEYFYDVIAELFAGGKVNIEIERMIQVLETRQREYNDGYVHGDFVQAEEQEQKRVGYIADQI